MHNRKTSINTYHRIKDEGLLSTRRWQVYDMLFNHGPLTANEIIRLAKTEYPRVNQTGFNARLSELKKMKLAIEVGEKKDQVSGNKCYLWDVTDNLPEKINAEERISRKRLLYLREILKEVYCHEKTPAEIKQLIIDRSVNEYDYKKQIPLGE